MMFEFATSVSDICKSFLIVTVIYAQKISLVPHKVSEGAGKGLTSGGKAYHDKKATMNPTHEKKKTRP